MNEGGGGLVQDASGYEHHGVLTGGAWTPYLGSAGLLFDGSGDLVQGPYKSQLTFVGIGFSIEAWVTFSAVASIQAIVGKPFNTTHTSPFFDWLILANGTAFQARVGASAVGTSFTLATNTLYQLVFTADGVDWRWYVNGVLDSQGNNTALPTDTNAQGVRIGANADGGEVLTGGIHLVRLWGRPITSREVSRLWTDPYEMFRTPPLKQIATAAAAGRLRYQNPLDGLGNYYRGGAS